MKPITLSWLILASAWAAQGSTAAWPAFRGPNSSGVSADAKPPINIGPTNAVLWKISVPWSPSSPCIFKDQIFLTVFDDHKLQTRCYRRADGALAWSRELKPDKLEMYHSTESSPATPSPATDGKRVVSYFGSFGLICYDLNGKELWRHELPVALSLGGYGTATSPLIVGNLVIVSRDRDEQSSLLALDLRTGKKVWETPRPDSNGTFSTPITWLNGRVEEVVLAGALRVKGYDLKTGKEDWMVEGVSSYVCTTPVTGDGLLFFAQWTEGKSDSPWPPWEKFLEKYDKNKDGVITLDEIDEDSREYFRGLDMNRDGKIDKTDWDKLLGSLSKGENVLVAVKPGGRGDITKTHVAWKATKGLPYLASPLLYNGRVYCVKNGGMLSSFDATTGKSYYSQERLGAEGDYYSSPVAADGRIYLVSVRGKLTVVKAGGDLPEILHQADFKERIAATPALAGDNLYLRTKSSLYAFGPAKAL
ncbi:MAG: pyrrolo-quinoline quinone [Verrucomicrobia bacterium]|nr:MAG: pyrrolo-quinoline quinone [Verrucomicrobiota bacterium]